MEGHIFLLPSDFCLTPACLCMHVPKWRTKTDAYPYSKKKKKKTKPDTNLLQRHFRPKYSNLLGWSMTGESLLQTNVLCLFDSLMSVRYQQKSDPNLFKRYWGTKNVQVCLSKAMPGESLLQNNTLCLFVSLMSLSTCKKWKSDANL